MVFFVCIWFVICDMPDALIAGDSTLAAGVVKEFVNLANKDFNVIMADSFILSAFLLTKN